MVTFSRCLLAATSLVVLCSKAHSEPYISPDIVITATRSPQAISRAGSAITVISSDDIAKASTRNLDDLLRQVPGLSLTQSGGPGSLQTVRIRGGDVRHTLVLMDGIRLNDPSVTGREFDFSNLVLSDVERIEVLRGPQSALYGSDALGGVINIITRKGKGAPKSSVSMEIGRYGSKEIKGSVSGATDRVSYALSASGLETAGFSAYGYRIGRLTSQFPRFEADGAKRAGFAGRVGIKISDDLELQLGGSANSNIAQYDASFGGFPDTPSVGLAQLYNGYARLLSKSFDGHFKQSLTLFANRTERKNKDFFYSGLPDFNNTYLTKYGYRGDRAGVEYQGDVSLGVFGLFTFGAKVERETAKGDTTYVLPFFSAKSVDFDAAQSTQSLFAMHQITLGERLHLSLGGRYDHVNGSDSFATWRATAAYDIPETDTVLRASAGTGGKTPSLFQLYSPLYGTPSLLSEHSFGMDAGIDQKLFNGRLKLSGTAFLNRYRNLIDFSYSGCPVSQPYGCYANVGRAETSGLELSGEAVVVPDVLKTRLTYTYLNAFDRETHQRLARRPQHEGRLSFIYTPNSQWSIEPSLVFVGERFSSNNEQRKLAPYARLDVYTSYKINETFSMFARAENLTNARYQEVYNYGTSGRAFYGGIKATW